MSDLNFEAPDGVWYDSPEGWLFTGIMGGCGCGLSEELAERSLQLLDHFSTPFPRSRMLFTNDESLLNEALAHWLDKAELIEHGTSIYGSWLTEKGREVLKTIKEAQNV